MKYGNSPVERALLLGVVSGLKASLGPALISAARDRPERKMLAMAAMGEMVLDKLPFLPSRSRLPLLLPRAFAGYWSAKQSLEKDGVQEGSTAYTAAAVSAGVAMFAPMIRATVRKVLGVPDAFVGAAEDYLAPQDRQRRGRPLDGRREGDRRPIVLRVPRADRPRV